MCTARCWPTLTADRVASCFLMHQVAPARHSSSTCCWPRYACGAASLSLWHSLALLRLSWMDSRAHSPLKLPLNLTRTESPTCNIGKGTGIAKVLQECHLIVWDECTMQTCQPGECFYRDISRKKAGLAGKKRNGRQGP